MKSDARNRLRTIVGKARKSVEEDISSQLLRLGITGNELLPISQLRHLDSEMITKRMQIEEAIEKERSGNLSLKKAIERYVRHVGFSFINRVAAFRAMEVRGLLSRETVARRERYAGYSAREYEISERMGISDSQEIVEIAFREACEEVSEEISVLFDLTDEYSIFFPSTRVVIQIYDYFGKEIPQEDWQKDDIIGWIYQYYNSEVRKDLRSRRIKPTAEHIPIITQFYTPDWIVHALVDNTLGKLWLELSQEPKMPESKELHGTQSSNEKIKQICSMLINPQEGTKSGNVSLSELRILDPACGSGHFLVYAFDVLYQMYLDLEPEIPHAEIPILILEKHLFGLDIDRRSVQLAALSLYLKAKSYAPDLTINKMNLVSSDIRLIDGNIRKEFLSRYSQNIELKNALSALINAFVHTPEAGSLVRIRESMLDIAEKSKEPHQTSIITSDESTNDDGQIEISKPPRAICFDTIINALEQFEREGMESKNMGTLLFAGEAEKSLGLFSILAQEYNVVLMNPPHSRPPPKTKQYLKTHYPHTKINLYSAFLEMATDLCSQGGYIGAVLGRPILNTWSFRYVRRHLFVKKAIPELVLDLGFYAFEGAHAQFAALTLNRVESEEKGNAHFRESIFVRLTDIQFDTKRIEFEKALEKGQDSNRIYVRKLSSFDQVPLQAYMYWASESLMDQFDEHPPLDRDLAKKGLVEKIADVKQGLATGDNKRFLRYWWEVSTQDIANCREDTLQGKKWVPFVDEFYLFYFFQDLQQVVLWENDGKEIRESEGAVIRNERYYFAQGLTWSATLQRTQLPSLWSYKRIPFRVLPKGCIFGVCAQGVILPENLQWIVLGICMSRCVFALSRLTSSDNKQGTGPTGKLPIPLINDRKAIENKKLSSLSKEAHDILREWEIGNEASTLFIKPLFLQCLGPIANHIPASDHPFIRIFEWADWKSLKEFRSLISNAHTIGEIFKTCKSRKDLLAGRLDEILEEIDSIVNKLFGISAKTLEDAEKEIDLQQSFGADRKNPPLIPKLKLTEELKKLLSFYVKECAESDLDGVVSLNQNTPNNIYKSIRQLVARDFGENHADEFYKDARKILGKSVDDWIISDYFSFATSLYRYRPIIWHITSANLGSQTKAHGAFNCLISYHKLDKDTLPKIRTKHLRPLLAGLKSKKSSLQQMVDEDSDSTTMRGGELSRTNSEIEELEHLDGILESLSKPSSQREFSPTRHKWTDEKIAEITVSGWAPVIDYGVRVNIKPLKDSNILHKDARRIK